MFSSLVSISRRTMCSDRMAKVNPEELNRTQQNYIKKLEKLNLSRAETMKSMRSKNVQMGWGLAAAVVCIFAFTIYRVRNEDFLGLEDET